jgi:hypothetical protein
MLADVFKHQGFFMFHLSKKSVYSLAIMALSAGRATAVQAQTDESLPIC